jgi:hypothetical protein
MTSFLSPRFAAASLFAAAILFTGCTKKTDNKINYTQALNTYYNEHPACLWRDPVKFPIQADTSDSTKTAAYDALVDQGLLVRTTAEKNKLIVLSKQVNNYDLSDQGHSQWVADPQNPGYGNFCYGHKSVQAIDSSTPSESEQGATTEVNYHTIINDAPAWAKAPETQNAYPNVHTNLSGPQTGEATLIDTNNGWQVGRIRPLSSS